MTDGFYKGYVRTSNKQCLEKFKGRKDFKTYEEVKSLPEYAGILADDTVLIDIDDKDQSEILFKIIEDQEILCRVYESRSGMHFLFKNNTIEKCHTKTSIAIALSVDIKVGKNNSYEVLKIEGKEREVIYDILDGEQYQEVPLWLTPIKYNMAFLDMGNGTGRNTALFSYILVLQSNGFSKEEIKQTIRIINKFVIKEPLSEDELEVILRDDAFKKEIFFQGKTFLHDKFANFLISEFHVVKKEGKLHIYNDGIYEHRTDQIERAMLKKIPSLPDVKRKEVLKYLTVMTNEVKPASENLIAFRNGIFNITTGQLLPFSPEYIITNRIPWDYNPEAYSKLADDTLNRIACGDDSIRSLLEECIGYTFFRSNILQKCFILTGEGANGKSTFIKILNVILGDDNVSAIDLKNLSDRFSKATIFGKLANIGDDISDDFISDPSLFKKIVSGDRIQAEYKGQDLFEFNPIVKLIFSANTIPRMKDRTGAVLRRLVIIPFNAKFTKDNDATYDPDIVKNLMKSDSIEYFIKLGVDALKRILINGFTESDKVKKELEDFREINNPILGFFKEQDEGYIFRNDTKTIYLAYSSWCDDNGFMHESKTQFGRSLKSLFNVESEPRTVNGNSIRMYVEITS